MALAAIYYFLPKLLGKPVSYYYLAPLAFWWLVGSTALAGGSRLIGAPVPVWIPTLGIVANMMLVLPLVIIGLNFLGTLSGRLGLVNGSLSLRFIVLSIAGFLLSSVLGLALSLRSFAAFAQFTLLTGLRDWLVLYGCFSTAMFGAAYFFLPRLTGREWRSTALVQAHFGATALGLVLVTVGSLGAGWQQAHLLHDVAVPFAEITKALAGWHTFHSVSLGVLLVGHLAFLINFFWLACPINSQGTPLAQINPPPALALAAKEGHA
jgi:cytochrome c oxidase cbb3-type subunit 1